MSGGDAQPTKSRIVQNEPNSAAPRAVDGGDCAKRSQTWVNWGICAKVIVVWGVARPGSENVQNEPNLGPAARDRGLTLPRFARHDRIADWRTPAGGGRRRQNARNEPNFPPPQAADGRNCAKRSQTWGDWGIWTKAVAVGAAGRPGSEMCKTNPIHPRLGAAGGGSRSKGTQFGPAGGKYAKQDARVKSRSQANRSSISAQKRWSQPDLGTFVVGVKQTQSRPRAEGVERVRPTPDQVGARLYEKPKRAKRTQFPRVADG
jgi:hypothetical protein